DRPALIGLESLAQGTPLAALLRMAYPVNHPAALVAALDSAPAVHPIALDALGEAAFDAPALLYLPPLPHAGAVETFQGIVARLRAPDGCPWDRRQTHLSLRQDFQEEAYELLDALDRNDLSGLREELGDVLLAVLMQTQIAQENSEFQWPDVVRGVYDKIVRRHPHVFAGLAVDGIGEVLLNWEAIKQQEKGGLAAGRSALDSVPPALPALIRAQSLLRHVRDGREFDENPSEADLRARLETHIAALAVEDTDRLGELLFDLCRLAQRWGVDAESALREANTRFEARFHAWEQEQR
ncbi:MAG: MazG family protein, partial [Anaerolineae bacterium]|nr:MazG family protein [Anaerolineae bacterium]